MRLWLSFHQEYLGVYIGEIRVNDGATMTRSENKAVSQQSARTSNSWQVVLVSLLASSTSIQGPHMVPNATSYAPTLVQSNVHCFS